MGEEVIIGLPVNTDRRSPHERGIMIRNELISETAVTAAENTTEPKSVQKDKVSVYTFGKAVYKVRTHFNLECTETLADVVGRLILQDLNDTDN